MLVEHHIDGPLATVILNDPDRRNALGQESMDALENALGQVGALDAVHVVLLMGNGPAFSAGFDLAAAVATPAIMESFILQLSRICRQLRRMPQVVVAAAQGAAIAGGCALISSCDFVFVDQGIKIGYPVHQLGISPAVSAPTLIQAIGAGRARQLQLSGELIDAQAAQAIGLAHGIGGTPEATVQLAREHCARLTGHGPHALRTTKAWLNQLDGSLDDQRFDPVAQDTAAKATASEARGLLADFWSARRRS